MPIPVQVHFQPGVEARQGAPVGLEEGPFETFLYDISEFGIGLLSKISFPWGVLAEMEFQRSALPVAAPMAGPGIMRIVGRVVHSIPHMGQFRIGISFTQMDDLDRDLIRRLLAPQPIPQERRRVPRVPLFQVAERPR